MAVMIQTTVSYKRHRFPPAVIAHAVWLYFRFPLSPRLLEEMLLERGIIVSYERFVARRRSSAPTMPAACDESRQVRTMYGIWMRWLC